MYNPTKPIDAVLIALNETENYLVDEIDKPFIEGIHDVFLFDRNRRTDYSGSKVPSYWLIHIANRLVLSDLGEALTDKAKDELYQKYECYPDNPDIYVCCYIIDGLLDHIPNYLHGETGVSYEEKSYEEQMQTLKEEALGIDKLFKHALPQT